MKMINRKNLPSIYNMLINIAKQSNHYLILLIKTNKEIGLKL